ncbi:hypothetical protein Aduo_002412 [Ancylostoma duodenale]
MHYNTQVTGDADDLLEMDPPAPSELADEDKQSAEEKLEESSAVEEPEISGEEQEEEEDFIDDEVEPLEETEGKIYIEEEADDSDDELSVIRRLEKSEFERKANREKWFDDEASLSGDDVGSDLDDDGEVANEYEAERVTRTTSPIRELLDDKTIDCCQSRRRIGNIWS